MDHIPMHEQVEHNPEFNKWWQEWLCAIAKRRGELGAPSDTSNCNSTFSETDCPTGPHPIERVM